MLLGIPVHGSDIDWTIVAEEGRWYPNLDKMVYNKATLKWFGNYTKLGNRLYADAVSLKREDDELLLFVHDDEVGSMNIHSGEITGLIHQKYQLDWNRLVLVSCEKYSPSCLAAVNNIIEHMYKGDMLELFLETHRLTRETKEELMLELCKLWMFRHGGLL
ncbi:MAG: hypothetical protein NC131_19010 [Roseburia sp.]|nr:hypothetical protein [Roseburia sp.]